MRKADLRPEEQRGIDIDREGVKWSLGCSVPEKKVEEIDLPLGHKSIADRGR